MPFSGSGTFSPYTPGNPVVSGSTISSSAFNNTIQDIATGLTNAITRDGQSPATANIPMGGNKLTGLAAASANGEAVGFEQLSSYAPLASPTFTGTVTVSGAAEADIAMSYTGQTKATYFAKNASAQIGYFNATDVKWAWSTDYSYKTTFGGKVEADDITTYRAGATTTGYCYFGNTNTKYFGFDGTNFVLGGGTLSTSGAGLTGTAASLNAGIGVGQTWQDKTGVRAFGGGPYTNSTGKPIEVSIIANTGTTSHVSITVDGVLVATNYLSVGGATFTATAQAIVPAGSTYSATGSGLAGWRELTA